MKLIDLSLVIKQQITTQLKKKKERKKTDQNRINGFGDLIATSFQTQSRIC